MRPLWGLALQKPRRCAPGRLACHVAVADRAGRQVELSWTSPSPPRCPASPRCWWASTSWEPDLGSVLGTVHGSILNRPQGAQRRLLRLGHSPDPRDIEPLIGPVAPQGAQMFATVQIPEGNGPVVPATGQPAPIGTHLEPLHRSLMRSPYPYALFALDIPPVKPPIAAPADQHRAGRTPGHGIDHSRMSRDAMHPFPALHIPHEQFPDVFLPLAPTARGQLRPIGAPGHVVHSALMSRQSQKPRAVQGVPHIHDTIIAATGQPRPVPTPRHPAGQVCLLTDDPLTGACGHLPHLYLPPKAPTGQPLSVWAPRHAIEVGVRVVGVPHALPTGSGDHVPHLDEIIPPAVVQPPPIRTPSHPVHQIVMTT